MEIYAKEKQVSKDSTKVAVIVQEMIYGDFSGVIFTKNPINQEDNIVIEYVKGLGEKLVGGEITPNQVILDRNCNVIKQIGEDSLQKDLLSKLINIVIKIENHFKLPQDVEFTIKNHIVYILQTRPITI